jgi:hypothetical protein
MVQTPKKLSSPEEMAFYKIISCNGNAVIRTNLVGDISRLGPKKPVRGEMQALSLFLERLRHMLLVSVAICTEEK